MSDSIESMQNGFLIQVPPYKELDSNKKRSQIASVLGGKIEETPYRNPKEFCVRDVPNKTVGYQTFIQLKLDGKIITSYGDRITKEQKEKLRELGYKIKIVEG